MKKEIWKIIDECQNESIVKLVNKINEQHEKELFAATKELEKENDRLRAKLQAKNNNLRRQKAEIVRLNKIVREQHDQNSRLIGKLMQANRNQNIDSYYFITKT